jgi:enolase
MLKSGVLGGERISKLNELVRLSEYGLIEGMAELS